MYEPKAGDFVQVCSTPWGAPGVYYHCVYLYLGNINGKIFLASFFEKTIIEAPNKIHFNKFNINRVSKKLKVVFKKGDLVKFIDPPDFWTRPSLARGYKPSPIHINDYDLSVTGVSLSYQGRTKQCSVVYNLAMDAKQVNGRSIYHPDRLLLVNQNNLKRAGSYTKFWTRLLLQTSP